MASGPINLEIQTSDTGVRYRMDLSMNYGALGKWRTAGEIEADLRRIMVDPGPRDSLMIYPDERTSFKTVMEFLLKLKAMETGLVSLCLKGEVNGSPAIHCLMSQPKKIVTDTRKPK